MPTERLSMRNTREILRQKWLLERPHRAVCASVGVSMGAVSQALKRAAGAKLTWEAVQAIDDEEPRRVCPRASWLREPARSRTARGFIANGTDPE